MYCKDNLFETCIIYFEETIFNPSLFKEIFVSL